MSANEIHHNWQGDEDIETKSASIRKCCYKQRRFSEHDDHRGGEGEGEQLDLSSG